MLLEDPDIAAPNEERQADGDGRSRSPWRARLSKPHVIALILVASSAAWAVVGSLVLMPYHATNNDESVYRLQADALLHGHLFPAAGTPPAAYRTWFTVISGHRAIPKYTPLFAALLAAGRWLFGSERAALALLAGAGVGLTYLLGCELLANHRRAAVAAAIVAASPVFLVETTTFMSYVLLMVLVEAFLLGAVRWARRPRPLLLVAAGFALGLAFFARPFDALLLGLPVLVGMGRKARKEGGVAQMTAAAAWLGVGAAPPGLGFLAYNQAATGSPLHLPFSLFEAKDSIGFGPRKMAPQNKLVNFSWWQGVFGSLHHLDLLLRWSAGGLLIAGLVLVALHCMRPQGPMVWVLACAAALPIGYCCFWGPYNADLVWGGTSLFGPFYFLPLVPVVALLAAEGLSRLRASSGQNFRTAIALAAVLTVATGVPVLGKATRVRTEDTANYRPLATLPTSQPSLVMVDAIDGPFLSHPLGGVLNPATLDSPRLFALRLGSLDFTTMAESGGRAAYLYSFDPHLSSRPGSGGGTLYRTELVTAPSVRLRFTAPPARRGRHRRLRIIDGTTDRQLEWSLPAGEAVDETVVIDATGPRIEGRSPDRIRPLTARAKTATSAGEVVVELVESRTAGITHKTEIVYRRSLSWRPTSSGIEMLLPGPVMATAVTKPTAKLDLVA